MDNLFFARSQMAMSLGFHIIFAAIGIAMPLLMVLAEWFWRRTGDEDYLLLTKAWSKGTAVFFAVGAVSGTVLSFELGLLFPKFMEYAGGIIGMPFSLEGFAFFTEGIFLGLYLYGWNRLSGRAHLAAGGVVAFSGAMSAVFVIMTNAWMNVPVGFRYENGQFFDIRPFEAMQSPAAFHQIVHMLFAAYSATAIAVAAIHAWVLLKKGPSAFHRKALRIALLVAVPASLAQPLIGHLAGERVAEHQPLKLAAMERQYKTEAGAPLRIGGIVDDRNRTLWGALEIPGGLSFLATRDFNGVVKGLEEFPEKDWPHPLVHYAFQLMVAMGMALAGVSAWAAWRAFRKQELSASRPLLWAILLCGPLGFLSIEAGWVVTEVGRQPWVITGILRTAESVTPMPGLIVPLVLFSGIYLGLGLTVLVILRHHVRKSPGYAINGKGGAK